MDISENLTLIISLPHLTNSSIAPEFWNHSVAKKWRDIIDPSLRDYVPELWLNYEPPSDLQHYILGISYLLIFFPAVFGNSAIIWLFYRCRTLRTPSNVLVVNLALSDLIQNLKMPVFIYNSFKCGPAMGELGCQIYGFFGGLSGTSAIMTIATMAIERLNSISRPLNPYSRLSMRRAIIISSLIWLYSFIFSTPPVFHLFNRYVPEGYLTSCSFDYLSNEPFSRMFILAFFAAAWVVPLTMIIISYTGIVFAVKRSEKVFKSTQKMLNDQTSKLYRASQRARHMDSSKMEMRLVKVVLCLVALWLISWTPYAVVALLGIFHPKLISPTSSMIPALFAKLSSVVNPYIYGLANPRFKRELKRKFCGLCMTPKTAAERRVTIATSTKTIGDQDSHFVDVSNGDFCELDFEMKGIEEGLSKKEQDYWSK